MKAIALFMLFLIVCGCSEQVTVVGIEDTDRCLGGYKVMTTFDSQHGRFKKCGWWGKVGESFFITRYS
jgi:hypothetical protein